MSARDLVGWVRDDGDEYHDFRYARAEEKKPSYDSPAGYVPVWFIPMCGPCSLDVHDDCHRYGGGQCGCTCTIGRRFFVGLIS